MSIDNVEKRSRGRPRRDTEPVTVRVHRDTLATIDNWAKTHPYGPLTRPEAIRQLISIGLGVPDAEE